MAGANIVSFDDATRQRAVDRPRMITDQELRAAQSVIDFRSCHVAFDRVSVEVKTATKRFTIFNTLSVAFPKGRRITVLGHKGSGKTTLVELMLRKRQIVGGHVHVNSRLSWPVSSTTYFDTKLTLRQNLIFVGRILGIDPVKLFRATCQVCGFSERQLKEKVKALPAPMRRRIGLIIVLAADFDCHLIDGAVRASHFGVDASAMATISSAIFDRDYIAFLSEPKQMSANCNLAYILYHGRLYLFDDVPTAVEIFSELPVPEVPGDRHSRDDDDDDDDEEVREEVI